MTALQPSMTQATTQTTAKVLFKALRPFIDTTTFGRQTASGGISYANPTDFPFSKSVYPQTIQKNINIADTFGVRQMGQHISPDGKRYYLANTTQQEKQKNNQKAVVPVYTHLLCLDIDANDFHDAMELAADIVFWLFSDLPVPPTILPSTSGRGAHVWLVVKRFHRMAPGTFCRLMEQASAAIKQLFPADQSKAGAWVDHIKGLPWYYRPNPDFSPGYASAPAVPSLKKLEMSREETGLTIIGWYRHLKRYSPMFEYVHELEPVLQTFNQHTLVAFPCAGRADLVEEFCRWLEKAKKAPIPSKYFQEIVARFPVPQVEQEPQPQGKQSRVQELGRPNRCLKVLHTTQDKPKAAMAAAQLGLQRHGPAVTIDQINTIYEQEAVACTGEATPWRLRRLRGALGKAKLTYNPRYARKADPSGTSRLVPPEPDDSQVSEIATWIADQPVDWDMLSDRITGRGRSRRASPLQMATIYCAYRWCIAYRIDGSADSHTVKDFCARRQVSTNGRGLAAYREELVRIDALRCLDPSFRYHCVDKCQPRQKGYSCKWARGDNEPDSSWLNVLKAFKPSPPATTPAPIVIAASQADAAQVGRVSIGGALPGTVSHNAVADAAVAGTGLSDAGVSLGGGGHTQNLTPLGAAPVRFTTARIALVQTAPIKVARAQTAPVHTVPCHASDGWAPGQQNHSTDIIVGVHTLDKLFLSAPIYVDLGIDSSMYNQPKWVPETPDWPPRIGSGVIVKTLDLFGLINDASAYAKVDLGDLDIALDVLRPCSINAVPDGMTRNSTITLVHRD